MKKIIETIIEKGWTVTVTFRTEDCYCFIFSSTGKDIGFAKAGGYDEAVLTTAYERAVTQSKKLATLKKEAAENNPLLFGEDL